MNEKCERCWGSGRLVDTSSVDQGGQYTFKPCPSCDTVAVRGLRRQLSAKETEVEHLRKRSQGADDQLVWLAQWCKGHTGVENNTVIGRDGWPHKLVEVVAKAIDEKIEGLEAERDELLRMLVDEGLAPESDAPAAARKGDNDG